jgi:hypothetical protein
MQGFTYSVGVDGLEPPTLPTVGRDAPNQLKRVCYLGEINKSIFLRLFHALISRSR